MPFGSARVKFCDTVPDADTGVGIYQSSPAAPLSSTQSPQQRRRIRANVVSINAADAPAPSGMAGRGKAWRLWTRPAPVTVGDILAGEKSTSGLSFAKSFTLTYGFVEIGWRRQAALNTKFAMGLMPTGGWYDPQIPWAPGTKRDHEDDIAEEFDNVSRASLPNGPRAKTPMHWRTAGPNNDGRGDAQVVFGDIGADMSAWGVTRFETTPDYADLLHNGIRSKGTGSNGTLRWPLTDPRFLHSETSKWHLWVQMALLVDAGLTLGTTPWENDGFVDLAYVRWAEWVPDSVSITNQVPPIPAGLAVDAATKRVTWTPVTDPEGQPVTYAVRRAAVTGGLEAGTVGAWTELTTTLTGTSYIDSSATAGDWSYQVAAQDERGASGRSGWSGEHRVALAPAANPPVAAITVRSPDGVLVATTGGVLEVVGSFTGRVSGTGTTGTVSRASVDAGDGVGNYPGPSLPTDASPWEYTWTAVGNDPVEYTARLTVTDETVTPNVSDSASVTVRLMPIGAAGIEPVTGLPLATPGQRVRAADHNALVSYIRGLKESMVPKFYRSTNPDEEMRRWGVVGDEFDSYVENVRGVVWRSDGSVEPTDLAPSSGTPGTAPPPSATRTVAGVPEVKTEDVSSTAISYVLPAAITPDTVVQVAVVARVSNATNLTVGITGTSSAASWTIEKQTNGVSVCPMWVVTRTVGDQADADSLEGQTVTLTLGVGANWASMMVVDTVSTGVVSSKFLPNAASYKANHDAPGTVEPTPALPAVATTQADQMVRCWWGGRGNSGALRTWSTADAALEGFTGASTNHVTENEVALATAVFYQATAGSTSQRIATVDVAIASSGAQYAHGHP